MPARLILTATDGPTDWYYAGLDLDWNRNDDPYVEYSEFASGDAYPEVFVGRMPARDSTEAAAMVTKLFCYERKNDALCATPPDSFYTKSLLIAGLTNFGGWDLRGWTFARLNGIYLAEYLRTGVFSDHGFSAAMLYPSLPATTPSCGSGTLECYGDIKTYFSGEGLTYPPGPVFNASNAVNALNEGASPTRVSL